MMSIFSEHNTMAKKINKNAVEDLLTSLSTLSGDTSLQDEKGNLDIKKLNEHPKVLDVVGGLRALGVKSNSQLSGMGFMAAAMVLRFK